MYRWCAKHNRLVMMIVVLPITAFLVLTWYSIGFPPIWFVILFALLLLFLSWGFVNSCARRLLYLAVKASNDHCDPVFLLKETEDQMSYMRSKSYQQLLIIDHCCALRDMGECQNVLEQLQTINIDKYPSTLPIIKVVYYNNLADIYLCLDQLEKAEIWHNKCVQMLDDLKNKKHKKMFSVSIHSNAAEIAYVKEDYVEALTHLDAYKETTLKDAVCKALLYAKIYIAQDKIDQAKEKLAFVIKNGNKLIAVQEAQKLLTSVQ